MAEATLLITSRNYSSWSLRGFLLCRLSGLPFATETISPDDPVAREELLLRSSSIRYPCLVHDGVRVWDVLAIAEYLNEILPAAGMLPEQRHARALCRAISGEMHSGFAALRSSLPMNLKVRRAGFPIWSAPRADIAAIEAIWRDCLDRHGGPWLFGARPSIADAMYAPVATRFRTYDVRLAEAPEAYARHVLAWPDLVEWAEAARREPEEEIAELEIDF
ncbi:glutathione S-transferase [Roseomonas eburnea]|uniref:Glutathione S-transferase n=1 Tax=Neoroseomonas eburnea TaxID=1346889 RepID=A0A9X9X5H3_9PROT|nr:glutathione S-transferase [Neoroseomonas eburnea]MBR0678959.1 glutathione S-transferase [Neoroseomonas eburnea]